MNKNTRKVFMDKIALALNDTHFRVLIEEGYIKIDIVDSSDKEIILMDNTEIPNIRKDFNYKYKCPTPIEITMWRN